MDYRERDIVGTTIKVRDLLPLNITIDVYDDYDESLGIAFCGPMYLKSDGLERFGEILDFDIYINDESTGILNVDKEGNTEEETENNLEVAINFFESMAGYCTPEEFEKWFSDEPIEQESNSTIKTNKERFSNEIDAVLNNTFPERSDVKIMDHTPKALLDLGLEDKPIFMSQQHVRNCLHEKGKRTAWHGLKKENLLSIEEYLTSPVLVYDSLQRDDSVVVVTREVDVDNYPVVVALRTTGEGFYEFERVNSNYLTSIYGHEHFENQIKRAVSADKLLFIDKEKTQSLGNLAQIQFLYGLPQTIELSGIIHKSNNIVNENDKDGDAIPLIKKESPFSDITVNGRPFENINDAFKELVDLHFSKDKDE